MKALRWLKRWYLTGKERPDDSIEAIGISVADGVFSYRALCQCGQEIKAATPDRLSQLVAFHKANECPPIFEQIWEGLDEEPRDTKNRWWRWTCPLCGKSDQVIGRENCELYYKGHRESGLCKPDETSPEHFAVFYEQEAAREWIQFLTEHQRDVIHGYIVLEQAGFDMHAVEEFWASQPTKEALDGEKSVIGGLRGMAAAMRLEANR